MRALGKGVPESANREGIMKHRRVWVAFVCAATLLAACAGRSAETVTVRFDVTRTDGTPAFIDGLGGSIPESELSDVAPLGAVVEYYGSFGVAVASIEHSWTAGGKGDDVWRFLDSNGALVAELRFSNPARLVAREGMQI